MSSNSEDMQLKSGPQDTWHTRQQEIDQLCVFPHLILQQN